MALYLEQSPSRKAFKSLLGNANHLIITALVGLDGIERGVVRGIPDDLRTVWSPKNAVNSARRSRRLILDMALIRAIDAIDVYLREAVRKPALVQSNGFRRDLDAAVLSIFRKLQAVARHGPDLNDLPLAIVFVMVAWRNRSAHTEADRDAPEHYLDLLRSSGDEVASRFSGLSAEMLLDGYEAMRPPTFKEVASLINAAHHLVAAIDELMLNSLDIEQFLKDVVWTSLSDSRKLNEQIEQARKRRAASIWGKDPSDRGDAVLRLLAQKGFSKISTKQRSGIVVPEVLISTLQRQTPKSVLRWARPAD
ncbi:hypothetical protein [Breoghania sp.]|uniref:hypothetical protein n=1 Tax=Breoghania sp. TaxID=2065378 RepID=UPI002AA67DF1|nr:hypothetical protein [Breoghania sp.]